MSHALPESEPQPTGTPELYTRNFWLITIARMTRGAAVGGTAAIGSKVFDNLHAVPWQAALTGVVVGAAMSLGASLANQFIPNNTASAFVARFTGGQAQ